MPIPNVSRAVLAAVALGVGAGTLFSQPGGSGPGSTQRVETWPQDVRASPTHAAHLVPTFRLADLQPIVRADPVDGCSASIAKWSEAASARLLLLTCANRREYGGDVWVSQSPSRPRHNGEMWRGPKNIAYTAVPIRSRRLTVSVQGPQARIAAQVSDGHIVLQLHPS